MVAGDRDCPRARGKKTAPSSASVKKSPAARRGKSAGGAAAPASADEDVSRERGSVSAAAGAVLNAVAVAAID